MKNPRFEIRSSILWLSVLCLIGFPPVGTAESQLPAPSRGTAGNITTKPAARPVKDKWALVVGISKFRDSKLNLKYPDKDARDFYQYLVTEGRFAPDHIVLLTNEKATRTNILSAIGDRWLPRLANPDDLVVIYVSTHGSPADIDVGGVNYLIAHDTDLDSLYATGIPLQDLMRIIKARVHCERVVIILDACHSGAASAESKGLSRAGNVSASEVNMGTGQLVIASSKPTQMSWEGAGYPNSVFTKNLIESLRIHGDKTRISEAFVNLKDKVQEEVIRDRGQVQTPELKSSWRGDELALAIIPSQPRAALPFQLSPSATAQESVSVRTETTYLPPHTVLDNGNIFRVFNQPTNATTFNIDAPSLFVYAFTYHWNDGKGKPPGSIALRHQDGSIYGPWKCAGKPGQGGVPNAYWECEPLAQLKPGSYTVIDSDPPTWAQNSGSNGCGIARIKVSAQKTQNNHVSAPAKNATPTIIYSNGNIYLVRNHPKSPCRFTIGAPSLLTSITNYHWNNGKGKKPGTITLVHEDGTRYGPWQSMGQSGQANAPNVYWRCHVNQTLKRGTYTVLDSDEKTWSQNELTGGAGITEVQGLVQAEQ